MKFIPTYILTLFFLAIFDSIWLGFVAKDFYKKHLGGFFKSDFSWLAIIIFYLIYALAIVYFVISPAEGSQLKGLLSGLFFGFVVYMTYDLVNYATLKGWTLSVVFIDIFWGSLMTAVVSFLVLFFLD